MRASPSSSLFWKFHQILEKNWNLLHAASSLLFPQNRYVRNPLQIWPQNLLRHLFFYHFFSFSHFFTLFLGAPFPFLFLFSHFYFPPPASLPYLNPTNHGISSLDLNPKIHGISSSGKLDKSYSYSQKDEKYFLGVHLSKTTLYLQHFKAKPFGCLFHHIKVVWRVCLKPIKN
jgi:hypothetical protein